MATMPNPAACVTPARGAKIRTDAQRGQDERQRQHGCLEIHGPKPDDEFLAAVWNLEGALDG